MIKHRTTAWLICAILAAVGSAATPARAAMSLGGVMAHSPDDISGFTTLSGNDSVASVILPFTFVVEGTNYTTLALSTNGWIEFGGNTSGDSDPSNDCLPTSAHSNPFLAAYWDDLQTFNTNVRYGTVGSSPNRVFIADFSVELVSNTNDVPFQVQLHEGSNTITVRYRNSHDSANGQAATIGFQGAGGGAATTVQPLSCNAKILDDNRPDEGWSADVGRAGLVTLAAMLQHSPDDISGFTSLTGNDNTATVALPFSVTLEGAAYTSVAISTNGWLEFGGNTAGNSDPTNDCLPTPAHTNPFLAVYWDDLNPFGNNVRYNTIGSSPNRVFIVDYEVDLTSGSEGSDDLRFQVQIHERSNLINVRYWDKQSGANGQAATIGFQGAGGASSVAYPLTCDAKILDDNNPSREGWSVHPKSTGAVSLHSITMYSSDDISGIAGLQTFSGNDVTRDFTLPFNLNINGTNYTALTMSTNGWIEFGGNTSGDSDPTNDCLPTAAHTNPFLAAFWDDMVTAGASTVEYGVVGTSPNRTFIADFFLDTRVSGDDGGDDVSFQVQVHERSNTMSVVYYNEQNLANGQTATIGFQGAGGAAAAATAVGCNAKVLDDNRVNSAWSVAPLPICGNGIVETKEPCDLGGSNGALTSCCTGTCQFRAAGQTCRVTAGDCDVAETCTGSSATCPGDIFALASTVCRVSAGVCDPQENCPGSGPNCPADAKSSSVCRISAGICDVAESCDGVGNDCPADGFALPSVVCRSDAGECDVQETCDGAGNCPADAFEPNGTSCGSGLNDDCTNPDTCNGSGTCQSNHETSGTACASDGETCTVDECNGSGTCTHAAGNGGSVCRTDAGDCDVQEVCDGSTPSCPVDAFEPAATACGDLSDTGCTNPDTCDGSGLCEVNDEVSGFGCGDPSDTTCDDPDTCDGAGTCEVNNEPVATLCRAASVGQLCDEAEFCDGLGACPADGVKPNGTLCRADAGECDVQEVCDGVTFQCPADSFEPAATACGDPIDTDCTNPDACDGGGACQINDELSGFACGDPSDTDCANPDTCDGAGTCDLNDETAGTTCTDDGETCTVDECDTGGMCTHPAGNAGAECRAASAGQLCDEAEVCDGSTPSCPVDGVKANGTVCRADAGDCDVEEQCDGASSACPADAFEPAATACGDPSNTTCTDPDTCDGSGTCLGNHEPITTLCRAASQDCDEAENCNGAGSCPADGFKASGTECRASAGDCDIAEQCDGASGACPADSVEPSSTICRADAGTCDVAETCNGSSATCPADGFEADGTGCSNGAFCDGVDTCQSGACTSPGTPCGIGDTCNEGADACFMGGCPLTVDTCRTAVKSKLLIKDKADNTKDKLIWKWIKGQSTDQGEFANPETTADYAFCVYAGATPTLIAHAEIPPNATLWDPISTKGYKYKDKDGTQDSIQKVLVKGSTNNKSKALLKGKGAGLPDVTLPIAPVDLPVIAQLRNNSSGICWGASFAAPIKNDTGQFKGKN